MAEWKTGRWTAGTVSVNKSTFRQSALVSMQANSSRETCHQIRTSTMDTNGDERLAQLLATLHASQQLSRDISECDLIAAFVRGVASIIGGCRVRLLRRERGVFVAEFEAERSSGDDIVIESRQPIIKSEFFQKAFRSAAETGLPMLFSARHFDTEEPSINPSSHEVENSLLCVPLPANGRYEEILCVDGRDSAVAFDASLVACLQILTAQAAVALKHVRHRTCVEIENKARAKVEMVLRDTEHVLAQAQRVSRTGSWKWNTISDKMDASEECFRIYEIPYERSVPSSRFADLTHPDDSSSVRIALDKAIAARRIFKLEFRISVGFGEIKYVQMEGHPQVDKSDGLHYVGVTVDVTERRNAENALQTARAELARAHRLSTMGELAASIIHEIYQPLTGIITNAQVCLRWLSISPPETLRAGDSAKRVVRDACRAADVFKGLRAIASSTGIVKVPVDIDDAIREVASLLQGELDRARIRLRLEIAAQRPVLGDRTQIQQVLENLIRNAMDALLPITGRPRHLIISSVPVDALHTIVTVRDNGGGFGQHSPEELFDALFTTKPNGMGMGLKVCRSIVEGHGGTLRAGSNDGQTVFQFTLPYISSKPNQ
ncbi:histidine kinase/DNA gyrase B/HSP90-like ATPase [Paraburkholderia sp. BL8N3]|nr:histidine kinase/DNA gyrase B/HSP90-like ATPase [Paraburkholderia sp. BL8N3]